MRYAAIAWEVVHINDARARVGILGHVQPVHFEAEGGSTSARDLLDLGRQGCRLAGAQIAIWGEYLAYPEYVVANGEDLQVATGVCQVVLGKHDLRVDVGGRQLRSVLGHGHAGPVVAAVRLQDQWTVIADKIRELIRS